MLPEYWCLQLKSARFGKPFHSGCWLWMDLESAIAWRRLVVHGTCGLKKTFAPDFRKMSCRAETSSVVDLATPKLDTCR